MAAALLNSTTGRGRGEEAESSDEDDDEAIQIKPPAQKKQKQGTGNRNHTDLQNKTIHEHPVFLESEAKGTMGQMYK